MGEEKPAEWYTGKSTERNVKKYMPLYLAALDLVKQEAKGTEERIIEMGCGTGELGKLLYDNSYINYLGVDFSPDMIAIARQKVPAQEFIRKDLRDTDLPDFYNGCTFFVCLETFEHIEDDFAVIDMIPKNSVIIFSLPTFDAKAHVRKFKQKEHIYDRYGTVIDIQEYKFIRKWHLCKGIKK